MIVRSGEAGAPARRARRLNRRQRAWSWYDFANASFYTLIAGFLFAPYLTAVANEAACGHAPPVHCSTMLHLLGISVYPADLWALVVTTATIASAFASVAIGVVVDRSSRPLRWFAGSAALGAAGSAGMVFVSGGRWQLGAALFFGTTIVANCSLVAYDALLPVLATASERDEVSCRAWAFGYVGGAIVVAAAWAMQRFAPSALGWSDAEVVRGCLLFAGLWWAGGLVVTLSGLRGAYASRLVQWDTPRSGRFAEFRRTLRSLPRYPQTMLFVVAYLFYNDGVQTVVTVGGVFLSRELGLDATGILATVAFVQVFGYLGARGAGILARALGAHGAILRVLGLWVVAGCAMGTVPQGSLPALLATCALVGTALGATQPLSRSLYSQLIPQGSEAQFFGLYHAVERGTSWFGAFVFTLSFVVTGSYRWAIFVVIGFCAVGATLLSLVRPDLGIRQAGNTPPRRV